MTTLHHTDDATLLAPEVDDLLLQVRGLALVRDLLSTAVRATPRSTPTPTSSSGCVVSSPA